MSYNPTSTSWLNPMSTIAVDNHPVYRDHDEIFEFDAAAGGTVALPVIKEFPAMYAVATYDSAGTTAGYGFICATDFNSVFSGGLGINITTSAPNTVQTQYTIADSIVSLTNGSAAAVRYRIRRVL